MLLPIYLCTSWALFCLSYGSWYCDKNDLIKQPEEGRGYFGNSQFEMQSFVEGSQGSRSWEHCSHCSQERMATAVAQLTSFSRTQGGRGKGVLGVMVPPSLRRVFYHNPSQACPQQALVTSSKAPQTCGGLFAKWLQIPLGWVLAIPFFTLAFCCVLCGSVKGCWGFLIYFLFICFSFLKMGFLVSLAVL